MDYTGTDPTEDSETSDLTPFIDTDYFDFSYGDTDAGERVIDSQYASSTHYVADSEMLFGVNFADGRIKGYELTFAGEDKTFTVACMRENDTYGVNDLADNDDGTITDSATGLMWSQDDSGVDALEGLDWEAALAYVEAQNEAGYLGYSDWRLPNVKELEGVVDYTHSPESDGSAAIDPLFNSTEITNELGDADFSYYWSSTTHASWSDSTEGTGTAALRELRPGDGLLRRRVARRTRRRLAEERPQVR